MKLDATDRAILNRLQEGFPIGPAPFAAVAEDLGLDEAGLIGRLKAMHDGGLITRFGPFFDAEAMGGAFCLCAMAVPEGDFEAVLSEVNARPQVAHNYERRHRLNMWFVLATESAGEIATVADEIERATGYRVLRFPKLREFFIGFRIAA